MIVQRQGLPGGVADHDLPKIQEFRVRLQVAVAHQGGELHHVGSGVQAAFGGSGDHLQVGIAAGAERDRGEVRPLTGRQHFAERDRINSDTVFHHPEDQLRRRVAHRRLAEFDIVEGFGGNLGVPAHLHRIAGRDGGAAVFGAPHIGADAGPAAADLAIFRIEIIDIKFPRADINEIHRLVAQGIAQRHRRPGGKGLRHRLAGDPLIGSVRLAGQHPVIFVNILHGNERLGLENGFIGGHLEIQIVTIINHFEG